MDYSAAALLASIRRRGMLPSATATGTADADLLALANEELQNWLTPMLLDLREDYLLSRTSETLTAGVSEYRIPSRAFGAKLRELEIVESSGAVRNLIRVQPDELENWTTERGRPTGFYLRGNYVVLLPTPASAETLRFTYYLRPSELTTTATDYDTVDDFDSETNAIIVVDGSKFSSGDRIDIVSPKPGFDVKATDFSVSVNGNTLVCSPTATLPTDLAAGDYVCLAEKSPVPNLPAELHPILAQRVVVKLLEAQGDFDGMARAQRQLDEMTEQMRRTFAPRVDGEAKVCAPDAHGLMGGIPSRMWW